MIVTALFLVFALIAGVIWFVQWRAGHQRQKLRGPWTALANKLGGSFTEGSGVSGSSIAVAHPTHTLQVKMTLVSAVQAAGVPYCPDGGTFTEVVIHLQSHSAASFIPPGIPVQTFVDHETIPMLANLGANAQIFLEPKTARVVLPGACESFDYLDSATQSLELLLAIVTKNGPIAAQTAATAKS